MAGGVLRCCSLRLWVFLAHLVDACDLLPPQSDDEEATEAVVTVTSHRRAGLQGAWDDGNFTGTLLWDSAMHTTAFLLASADWATAVADSHCVLELGAGLGLPAFACAAALGAQHVVASDRAPQVLDLLDENIARNFDSASGGLGPKVSAVHLDWSSGAGQRLKEELGVPCIDVVICCDCIHEEFFGATKLLAELLFELVALHVGLRVLVAAQWRKGCPATFPGARRESLPCGARRNSRARTALRAPWPGRLGRGLAIAPAARRRGAQRRPCDDSSRLVVSRVRSRCGE